MPQSDMATIILHNKWTGNTALCESKHLLYPRRSTCYLWFGWTRLVLAQSSELDPLTRTSISWIPLLLTIENRTASRPAPMVGADFQPLLTCPLIPSWWSEGVGIHLLSTHPVHAEVTQVPQLNWKQRRKGLESSHGGQGGGSDNLMRNNLFCRRRNLLGT